MMINPTGGRQGADDSTEKSTIEACDESAKKAGIMNMKAMMDPTDRKKEIYKKATYNASQLAGEF
jgi:hypothetical protein